MRDFAKLKILEVSAISWQYTGWSLVYLQLCKFFFFFFFFFLCVCVCVCVCAMGLMSVIGPEMTGVG